MELRQVVFVFIFVLVFVFGTTTGCICICVCTCICIWNYDRSEPGLNLTLAKYWDGRYMIGKFADMNLWDRRLTEDEMLRYTDCRTYHQPKGNLMDGNDTWSHDNQFIKDFEVSWDDVQCSEKNNFTTAPIAAVQGSFRARGVRCIVKDASFARCFAIF